MKKTIILFLTTLIFSINYSQETSSLNFGDKMNINSRYLGEESEIWVKLPEDFEKLKDNCSILVLLDGDEYFGIATNVQNLYQWEEKMPATIVVAIPSSVESRWKYYTPTNSKNFTGQKDNDELFKSTGNFSKFADFVETDIIKYLEAKYNLKFKNKTIFGHSLGGLAVISFYNIRPGIFDSYICASPSLLWNGFMFNKYYSDQYKPDSIEKRKIFLSTGNPDSNGYKQNVEDLVNSLTSKIVNSEQIVKYLHYKTEDHGSSGIRSLIDGLEFVYESK